MQSKGMGALAAASEMDEESGEAGAPDQKVGQEVDPQLVELAQLVAGRAAQALQQSASELDTALKADPVQGAVQFGVRALRGVAMAADEAGKSLPLQAIVIAGISLIQVIAEIAIEKGYLDEGAIEVFLKEAFQQSLAAYAKLDMDDGMLSEDDMRAVQQKIGKGG